MTPWGPFACSRIVFSGIPESCASTVPADTCPPAMLERAAELIPENRPDDGRGFRRKRRSRTQLERGQYVTGARQAHCALFLNTDPNSYPLGHVREGLVASARHRPREAHLPCQQCARPSLLGGDRCALQLGGREPQQISIFANELQRLRLRLGRRGRAPRLSAGSIMPESQMRGFTPPS